MERSKISSVSPAVGQPLCEMTSATLRGSITNNNIISIPMPPVNSEFAQ